MGTGNNRKKKECKEFNVIKIFVTDTVLFSDKSQRIVKLLTKEIMLAHIDNPCGLKWKCENDNQEYYIYLYDSKTGKLLESKDQVGGLKVEDILDIQKTKVA